MRRMLRVENKDPVVRSRRTKESVEVDDDLGRKRGGAGGMKDSQLGIIVHDQGILRERFGTVRAAFRETLNPCPKALFVVEDEHMAFSYTNSWKLARSATSLALLKKSVRNGQGADKGLCQLDGSIRVNHVTVHPLHAVLDTMLDSTEVSAREKAVLHLLQSTGARIHEVALMTVGGYQNEGIAGQAQVMNKGSYGREIKTIYFAHNPRVQEALNEYFEQVRPLHDPQGRSRLVDVAPQEPLFLTERGTPYSLKVFYWHWYRHFAALQTQCPVRFSPHDLRHLFVTEFLIRLKMRCGLGTEHFDSEQYLSEREAFGSMVMNWRSARTIDIYDQSRNGEAVFSTLAEYQQDLSQRRYATQQPMKAHSPEKIEALSASEPPEQPSDHEANIVWMLDAETLDWIKHMEQQAGQQ